MPKQLKLNVKDNLRIFIIPFIVFLTLFLLNIIFQLFFNYWNNKFNDKLFNLRRLIVGKQNLSPSIIHIDIYDSSILKQNISMFDRSIYSKTLNLLKEYEVHSAEFDIIFSEKRDKNQDASLVSASKNFDSIYYPVIPISDEFTNILNIPDLDETIKETLRKQMIYPNIKNKGAPISAQRILTNFDELQSTSKKVGHMAVEPDDDGIFRKVPLLIKYEDGYIPFISLSLLLDYFKIKDENIDVLFGKYILLKNAEFKYGIKKNIKIPIDAKGNVAINYFGAWADSFIHYPIDLFLDDNMNQELKTELTGTIAVISDVTSRSKDYGSTPVEKVFPLAGIHSLILNSILQSKFIYKINFIHLALINLCLIFFFFIIGSKTKILNFSLLSIAVLILYQLFSIILFISFNVQPNIISPTISIILSYILIVLYRYIREEKRNLRYVTALNTAASNFVPNEFLQRLNKTNIIDVNLGDQIKVEMTILFSDIRSFTSISEKLSPEQNFNFINGYLSIMGPIVRDNSGFIDKYIGDAIMALFPNDPSKSIASAIKMKEKLIEYNSEREKIGEFTIDTGIGIHTGKLMLGIIGENKRYEGTVIADAVNIASRLEGLTKLYGAGIIISEDTLKKCANQDRFNYRFLDLVTVKGKKDPIIIYEILDGLDDKIKELKLSLKSNYETAFLLYKEKRFSDALNIYKEILSINPSDKAINLFIDRCKRNIVNGVCENWYGVEEMTEK
ncbi:MAG: adenylate/guanylate cyclase domain-containing protein [Spirochaetes bacterium]|nr:adenylate/guanylate cyclase domain-containing protein [Spirochaetota bacterium]